MDIRNDEYEGGSPAPQVTRDNIMREIASIAFDAEAKASDRLRALAMLTGCLDSGDEGREFTEKLSDVLRLIGGD